MPSMFFNGAIASPDRSVAKDIAIKKPASRGLLLVRVGEG
jgi:hypothetical protein